LPSVRPGGAAQAARLLLCSLPIVIAIAACGPRNRTTSKAEAIRRGDEAAAKYEFAAAASAYQIAVERDPSDGNARMKLAQAYSSVGRGADAMKESIRAAALLPGNVDAQVLEANLLLQSGSFLDASVLSARLLHDHPEDVNVIILWANAKAHLFSSGWVLYELPISAHSADDVDRARHDVRPEVPPEDDMEAEAAFRKALRLAPNLMDAQLALVNFLWAIGHPEEGEGILRRLAEQNPSHAAINYALGTFYRWRNRPSDAEPYLRNAAMAGTYGRDARFALADLYIAEHREGDALTTLRSMPAADDDSGDVSLRAAPIEFRLGQREEAMRRINGLLTRQPHNRRALLFKAQFLFAMRQLNDALKFAQEAVAEAPRSGEARTVLCQALSATGNLENAFAECAEAARLSPSTPQPVMELARLALTLGRDKEAILFAREAARLHPDDPDAAVLVVRALIRQQDFSRADQELKRLMLRVPEGPAVLTELGTIQAARGDVPGARAAFTRALASDPDSFEALSGVVSLDLKERRPATARQRVETALAAHPSDSRYLLLAARVYTTEDDARLTEATLRRALTIDGANIDAVLSLSDLLIRQNRSTEAKRVLEQLVQQKPRSTNVQTSVAMLLERMGQVGEARLRYQKIVALDPRAAKASFRLAALYVDEGDNLDVALDLAIEAKQQLPEDPATDDLVGWIYARKDLPVQALPHLKDAVRAAPNNPTFRYHLGSAYLSSGDDRNAAAELARALEIDGNFAHAAQARAALASIKR
jgi:tetratricopeptide (TPR) repeat protein